MKLFVDVEEMGICVECVNITCTPAEMLVLNHAMQLFADNTEMHEMGRDIMKRMLEDFAEGIDQGCKVMSERS